MLATGLPNCEVPRCHHERMKLFISSLIGGYEAQRAAVAHAAEVLRWEVLRAEDFGSRPDTPRHACLAAVREADVMVLLMGDRYGDVQDSGLSATHEEWQEAVRMQRPTLVFVEAAAERADLQDAFVAEVEGYSAGRIRESFSSPQELQDKVTRALADLQVPGLADEAEISHRALAALPAPQRGVFGGEARLYVAVAGGPRQQVLRPAEIEDRALISDLHREAMFGPNAPLDPASATQPSVNGDWLEITQERAAVSVHVDGTVLVWRTATAADVGRRQLLAGIVEEDVHERISSALRFAFEVLERIDDARRVSSVTPCAVLRDAGHTPWMTRSEMAQSPGSMSMSMGNGAETEPVILNPSMVRRSALVHDADRIAQDLTVLLRRQRK